MFNRFENNKVFDIFRFILCESCILKNNNYCKINHIKSVDCIINLMQSKQRFYSLKKLQCPPYCKNIANGDIFHNVILFCEFCKAKQRHFEFLFKIDKERHRRLSLLLQCLSFCIIYI